MPIRVSITILVLLFANHFCYSQDKYNIRLAEIQEEIKQLTYFNNGVVVYDDSSGYGSTYPYWTPSQNFFEDEIVVFQRGTIYRAILDNRGKIPTLSPNEWVLMYGPHPYLFLRDSAETEDLVRLLTSDHPYIRIYAFGALVNRKADNLFQIVVNNLADTTKIMQFTSDSGYTMFPADLMLWYVINGFDIAQKDSLKQMMLTRYAHLRTLEEILLFHKPTPEDYPYVREIAARGTFDHFGLIALSKYKKPEDIELIRKGFTGNDHYAGYKIFFLAIESFPDKAFKDDLIAQKTQIRMDYGMSAYKYYFNALARYRDKNCLNVLDEFVNQPEAKNKPYRAANYRNENLMIILQALKKYPTKLYDKLISKIEAQILAEDPSGYHEYRLEESPWNY